MTSVSEKLKEELSNNHGGIGSFEVTTEFMSLEKKLEFLNQIGRNDLVDVFKEYKPRVSKQRKRGAPLDQRVIITVSEEERKALDDEIAKLKSNNQKVSMSQLIRHRAMGSVDIERWREVAEKTLSQIEEIHKSERKLKKNRIVTISALDELDPEKDDEEYSLLYGRKLEIEEKLNMVTAQYQNRKYRLTGRMSLQESETVKWRAQQLSITASDYLRMMIFDLEPNSSADSHMSFDTKRRFYVSILSVAANGWAPPPHMAYCKQCENYIDEIRRLKERISLVENFSQ